MTRSFFVGQPSVFLNSLSVNLPAYTGYTPSIVDFLSAWGSSTNGQICKLAAIMQHHRIAPGPGCTYMPVILKYPTPTPTRTPTKTRTPTITRTPTRTLTPTKTRTPTVTLTPTKTRTPTPGPSPTPSRTPTVHSPQCANQALVNTGFESGLPGTPWQFSASNGHPVINQELPHAGVWGARLGGYNSASDRLYQGVIIPSGAYQMDLTFWWYMTSSETLPTAYDVLSATLKNTSGAVIGVFTQINNTATRGVWVQWQGHIPISSALWDQVEWLTLGATTDASLPTYFYVDDATVNFQCGGTQVAYPGPEEGGASSFLSTLSPPPPYGTSTPTPGSYP